MFICRLHRQDVMISRSLSLDPSNLLRSSKLTTLGWFYPFGGGLLNGLRIFFVRRFIFNYFIQSINIKLYLILNLKIN